MLVCAVMFISLYNKPEWYEEVVPTKLVPAVSIRGRVVWESVDILKAGYSTMMSHDTLVQA
jgi:glutathione S-transferase